MCGQPQLRKLLKVIRSRFCRVYLHVPCTATRKKHAKIWMISLKFQPSTYAQKQETTCPNHQVANPKKVGQL